MPIDRFLPDYDVRERHSVVTRADRAAVWRALHTTDFSRSWIIRMLFRLRGLRRPDGQRVPLTLASFERWRFARLHEEPERELVLGLVGRFWTLGGHLRRIDSTSFREPLAANTARAAWSFRAEPHSDGTRLTTETRVECSDAHSRRSFRRYWRVVRPFSGLIRRRMLAQVKKSAETLDAR